MGYKWNKWGHEKITRGKLSTKYYDCLGFWNQWAGKGKSFKCCWTIKQITPFHIDDWVVESDNIESHSRYQQKKLQNIMYCPTFSRKKEKQNSFKYSVRLFTHFSTKVLHTLYFPFVYIWVRTDDKCMKKFFIQSYKSYVSQTNCGKMRASQ